MSFASTGFVPSNCFLREQVLFILYFKTWGICIDEGRDMKYAMKSKTRKTSDVRGWMALDNVTSHFFTMLEPIASASFLSSLPIIHAFRASSEHILPVPWSFFLSRWLQCSSGPKSQKIQKVASEISEYFYLVYTKTVDSVFRALWLATQSVNILHYSLIHLQFLRASDAKLA